MAFHTVLCVAEFGPPALAFARTCFQLGIAVHLLELSNSRPPKRPYSTSLSGVHQLRWEYVGNVTGLRAISDLAVRLNADGIIAVSERILDWLARNGDLLPSRCRLLGPSRDCVEILASKESQIELAVRSGFSVLPTWYIRNPFDSPGISESSFPVCVRPAHPSQVVPLFKAVVLHDPEELNRFLRTLSISNKGAVIAQPFLNLPDLKVHGVRSCDGRWMKFTPFLAERKYQGVTLTLRRANFPPNVEQACEEFSRLAGLTGGFHFDLLFDAKTDTAYYLEVNARMGGITDKAKAFGFDQPRFILEAYGHPQLAGPPISGTNRTRVVTKRAVLSHMVAALKGELSELDFPNTGVLDHLRLSLRDLLFARDSVFDLRDWRGTVWFYTQRPAG